MSIRAVLFLLVALLLSTGCRNSSAYTKPTSTEIKDYIDANKVNDFDKACMLSGEYKTGMSEPVVLFLLGEPKERNTIKKAWATQDELIYKLEGVETTFVIEKGQVVAIKKEE